MTEVFDLLEQFDRAGVTPGSKCSRAAGSEDRDRTQQLSQLAGGTRVKAAIRAMGEARNRAKNAFNSGNMTEMVDTELFGKQPVLGTITDCKPTAYGWTGVMPGGRVVEVRACDPSFRKLDIPENHTVKSIKPPSACSGRT